tara:strand:+ start:378 stop:563 length:186 start_codon:yes stop_codon:yes gene_type:complete
MTDFFMTNYEQIVDIVAKVIAVAAAIAAVTPSRVDNDILTKILQFTNLLGLNVLKAKNKDD